MIKFDKLYINEEGNTFIVKLHVEDAPYYSSVNLVGLKIQGKNTYGTKIDAYSYISTEAKKELTLEIPTSLINELIKSNMLVFTPLYVGIVTEDAPCGKDVVYPAVWVETTEFIKKLKAYTAELANKCERPRGFINYFLTYKGLQYAIKVRDYLSAYKYLSMLQESTTSTTKSCGCNG
jgi:hypothetical protein